MTTYKVKDFFDVIEQKVTDNIRECMRMAGIVPGPDSGKRKPTKWKKPKKAGKSKKKTANREKKKKEGGEAATNKDNGEGDTNKGKGKGKGCDGV
jgi:hypothetical protein